LARWTTDDQLVAIRTALASGILTVETRYGRVTYQSPADLIRIIEHEDAEIARAAGSSATRSVIRFGPGWTGGRSFEHGGW
jgi:bifunctional N-acetylglucosamine-1-phosphate-uridyltransferase/glucosamine-1-phosphate-acetyltransferase GlmU-like protein